MKKLFPLLGLVVVLTGCTVVSRYVSKSQPGPAKPKDYPIYVYQPRSPLPRPCEIIGTMSIHDTPFTAFGGSLEGELKTLRENARQRGADALQLTAVEKPDFLHAKHRVTANFLRFTNAWENLALSKEELRRYFQDSKPALDALEGVWTGNDPLQSRVIILKNNSRPGRDFVALMLNPKNPSWRTGDKRMELARGERPGVYRGIYYQDDYQGKRVGFALRTTPANRFVIELSEDSMPIVFTRE